MTLTLPENIRAAMLAQLTGSADRHATPGQLAQHTDPRTIQTPALDLIDAALVDLLSTPDGRLIIHMAPQEGKSTRVAKDFPVWALTRNPELRIVTGSYAQSLANRNGRAVRNLIQSHPDLGLRIAPDNGAASEWTLEGHQGGVLSVGRGAGVTGRPADLLIIDDPIKDRNEADSATIRDTCWDWWTDALAARLAPGAPAVLIMTRWHEDDLAGRLATMDHGAPWRVLSIPAQCETPETDPLGREAGEFMVSARGRTQQQWEQRKATAGPRTWAALYQGHPSPAEGDIFKREWWRHWDVMPSLDGQVIQSWDLTFKGEDRTKKGRETERDWVVGQVWLKRGADCYLLDQARGRWGFSETVEQILSMSRKWPKATAKLVEDKANGPAVIDSLRHQLPGIIPVNPQGGKEARAAAVEPFLAAGNVHLPPIQWAWVRELIEEASGFPNASHDDQVDALTQAINWLHNRPASKTTSTAYRLG